MVWEPTIRRGPRGQMGLPGEAARTIRNGIGAPGAGLGVDGDFYIDNGPPYTFYGPKVAGAWGTGTTLSEGSWGSLTGTLSDQADLQAALNAKANTAHAHVIADTTGLQAALDLKASITYVDGRFTSLANGVGAAFDTLLEIETGLNLKLNSAAVSAFGLTLVDDADAATARGTLGLGTLATQSGTFSGTSSGTNTGDQTSIVGFSNTKAQFNTVLSDGDFLFVGDITSYTDEQAQDAVGAMVDTSLVYVDATPLLTRAALTGDVTAAQGSNATAIGNDKVLTAHILNGNVTLAKMADIATSSLIYRKTAGSGAPEVNTLATLKSDLGLTGTNSGDQASIVGITGTKAQFDTAVSDGNIAYVGDALAGKLVGGAWKVFYTDGSGVITELALGGAGSYLQSNGPTVIPSWATPAGSGDVTAAANFGVDNVIVRADGTAKGVQASGASIDDNGTLLTIAGAAGFAGLKLAAGTLMTTPGVGDVEVAATNVYMTTDAGNRGYVPIRHFIRADAARTLPNDLNENAIFNSPANGRLTLETGVYKFEAIIAITAMSATSGNALIDWLGAGTAVCASWLWYYTGKDGTNSGVANLNGAVRTTQDSAASIVTAGTGTEMFVRAEGTFEVTTGGTLIPSVDQVTATATASVNIGSYFMCERMGPTTSVSVGQWD